MSKNNDEDLRDLLARKKKLLNMKKIIIERSVEKEIKTTESFIEDYDITNADIDRSNIVSYDSNETICTIEEDDMDIINTSTMSLSRSHSFVSKIAQNFENIADDNISHLHENKVGETTFSPISYVIDNVQNKGHLNVVRETDATNSDTYNFVMPDKLGEIEHTEEINTTHIKQISPLLDNNVILIQNQTETNPDCCEDAIACNLVEKEQTIQPPSLLDNSTVILLNPSEEEEIVSENLIAPQEGSDNQTLSPTIISNETTVDLLEHHNYMDINILDQIPDTSHDDLTLNENENNSNNGTRSKTKRNLTSTFTKSCMDFYIDDEKQDFSSGSSDIWSGKDSTDDSEDKSSKKRKKTKRIKKNKDKKEVVPIKKRKTENKRKTRKLLREQGLSYETSSGKVKESRTIKENPCTETKCFRKCYEVSEDRRKSIFDYFWALTDEKKRDWIVQCCRPTEIKRKKTKNIASRRSFTYEYFINEGEGRRQVCQQFIIKTLDISQTFMLYNINHAQEGLSSHESRTRTASDKYDEDTKLYAKKYIETLPALPSHYSRKGSNKLYLPEEFRNISNLYRLYVKLCQETSKNYLSEKLFKNMFHEYNLAFHVPKKDKCLLCTKQENNPDTSNNEQLKNHLIEKDATYKRFKIHQNLKPDNALLVASFDLQKVLSTPCGESMVLYYSRKYAMYNFTVYESRTQNGYCYTWGEADGKRGSCEIATCLLKYLKEVDSRGVKTLLLYCDNCVGQNKNRVFFSMIKHFLKQSANVQVIQINYLLVGHTYMPVDSMHAVIEREVKKLIVWAPSQWPTFMESSRKQPKPYCVNVLEHTDFINFNNLADTEFTPATLKDKDLHLKNIRVCTFKKSNLDRMEVKYTMSENGTKYFIELAKETQVKRKGKGVGKRTVLKSKQKKMSDISNQNLKECTSSNVIQNNAGILPFLYNERLPISVLKYNDLKKLCDSGIIPKRFHVEYLKLPNKAIRDTLNDTDADDPDDRD